MSEERMSCCAAINADTDRFFSRFAGLHRLRFRVFGFEHTQRHLIEGIRAGGVVGADLLEIGCGPGYLHRALLNAGAARATGIDLSERMLTIARKESHADGVASRVDYRQGDFTVVADQITDADVVILDKVICCYPDWERLVERSLEKSRRLYAFTIPRDRALTRLGLGAMRWGLTRAGCCYQPFLHDPAQIDERVAARGFDRIYEASTLLWLTRVYARGVPDG
jgi:magnesium-protoporphyrin O-methyltransferase